MPGSFAETEDQKLLRDSLRAQISHFDEEYWRVHDEKAEFPREYFETLSKNGWFGLNLPVEYGGAGLGLREVAIAVREAGRTSGMAAADLIMAISVFAIQTIKSFANDSVREKFLPELGRGQHVVSFCLTEPAAGVNTLDISLEAVKDKTGFVLTGHKIWTTLAHEASLFIVVARTTSKNSSDPRKGLTLFLVDRTSIGRGEIRTKRIDDIAMRCLGSNEVYFDNIHVPDENVIGQVDGGWNLLPTLLNAERISTAAMSVGVGELALGKACSYARERIVFGRPIGSNQGIQFPLARARAMLDAAWATTQKAASEFDNLEDCSINANVAAYLGARAAFFASDRAIQTYGGLAFAKSSDVERHWRDSRLFRVGPVPEEMVLSFLGQRLLGQERSY